jgi:hypothetical protein
MGSPASRWYASQTIKSNYNNYNNYNNQNNYCNKIDPPWYMGTVLVFGQFQSKNNYNINK